MKKSSIDEIAYLLKEAKNNNLPKPIVFLGAGASVSGGIPLAYQIVEDILKRYSENPLIKRMSKDDRTYSRLMECLLPAERNKLLKEYIDKAKINVTHYSTEQ